MSKIEELAKFLRVGAEDLEESDYQESLFSLGNSEYLVYTDEEADDAVKEYIRESVWSFRSDWLSRWTGIPSEMLQPYQEKHCEDANEMILRHIDDFNDFVDESVSADGRGHFLSGYDGVEHEITIMRERENGIDIHEDRLYIYQVN